MSLRVSANLTIVSLDRAKDAPNEVRLRGNGTFSVEVLGEWLYQSALAHAAGARPAGGEDTVRLAELVLDEVREFDPKAASVQIEGKTVGHLPWVRARELWVEMSRLGMPSNAKVVCMAMIRRTWRTGGGREHFSVWLDLEDHAH